MISFHLLIYEKMFDFHLEMAIYRLHSLCTAMKTLPSRVDAICWIIWTKPTHCFQGVNAWYLRKGRDVEKDFSLQCKQEWILNKDGIPLSFRYDN